MLEAEYKNYQSNYKKLQEQIDKGEVRIIDLGVIDGIHRYKFIKILNNK